MLEIMLKLADMLQMDLNVMLQMFMWVILMSVGGSVAVTYTTCYIYKRILYILGEEAE